MLEQIEGLPAGVVGFRAVGEVTAADYENLLVPDVEAAFVVSQKLRLLYVFGPQFTGFAAGALWDDAKLGFRHVSGWQRVAVVTDASWLRATVQTLALALPGELKLFTTAEETQAVRWISESLDG